MIWARLLVSVFPVKSRVAPIEINPRWEEHSSIHHPIPNLAGSTRPRQHFNYSDRSNLILYCDAQLGSSLCGTATVVVGLLQDTNKEESEKEQPDSALDKLKATNRGVVKCRICKEDHWTTQCPYKDTLGPLRESLTGPVEGEAGAEGAGAGAAAAAAAPAGGAGGAGGKYVPPSRRGGDNSSAQSRISGDSMPDKRREDTAAIRVSNLSENAQEKNVPCS